MFIPFLINPSIVITHNAPTIIAITIPLNTDIIELILCLTTSVSLVASILGYFKLITKPNNDEIVGATKLIKIIVDIPQLPCLRELAK